MSKKIKTIKAAATPELWALWLDHTYECGVIISGIYTSHQLACEAGFAGHGPLRTEAEAEHWGQPWYVAPVELDTSIMFEQAIPIEQRIKEAQFAAHFGVVGTNPGSGNIPAINTAGMDEHGDPREPDRWIYAHQARPKHTFDLVWGDWDGWIPAVLDRSGWAVWGEEFPTEGDDTFHVVVYFPFHPDASQVGEARRALAGRLLNGRILDYAHMSTADDWDTEGLGTFISKVNGDETRLVGRPCQKYHLQPGEVAATTDQVTLDDQGHFVLAADN
jgi:hypothetical protein